MAEPTRITAQAAGYDISSIKTKLVTVNTAGVVNAKAGHLLFWDTTKKKFTASATGTDLSKQATRCVVLLEDADFQTTTDKTVQAIVAGTVYDSFVYGSGITTDDIADLSALNSGVTFLNRKEVAINE